MLLSEVSVRDSNSIYFIREKLKDIGISPDDEKIRDIDYYRNPEFWYEIILIASGVIVKSSGFLSLFAIPFGFKSVTTYMLFNCAGFLMKAVPDMLISSNIADDDIIDVIKSMQEGVKEAEKAVRRETNPRKKQMLVNSIAEIKKAMVNLETKYNYLESERNHGNILSSSFIEEVDMFAEGTDFTNFDSMLANYKG